MNCPHCGKECNALILETRKQDGGIVRKRACGMCGRSFLSMERSDPSLKMARARPDKQIAKAAHIEAGPKATSLAAFTAWK